MKLLVVVSSTAALNGAGVRIRYQRLITPLKNYGIQLTLKTIEQSCRYLPHSDVVLISKVMDARAAALANACHRNGALVGADLFDNYFSQKTITACRPQQRWLQQLAPLLDFGICSTEAMLHVVRQETGRLPLHLMTDCHGGRIRRIDDLQQSLRTKETSLATGRDLNVIWFGMGDNPIHDAGLSDLEQHGETLRELESTGRRVNLRVLTNERALSNQGLQKLSRLPVRTSLEIWDEELETRRLLEADVAFLPVAQTDFSRVKSPNRGITALEHGCQVLTTIDSVYELISPFTYTNSQTLLKDLEAGQAKVRIDTLNDLTRHLEREASTTVEAKRMKDFLHTLREQRRDSPASTLAILHGIQPSAIRADWCHTAGAISVRSPLTGQQDNDDIWFKLNERGEALLIIQEQLIRDKHLDLDRAEPNRTISRHPSQGLRELKIKSMVVNMSTATHQKLTLAIEAALRCRTMGEKLTLRHAVKQATVALLGELIPGLRIIDNEELPGWA
ncbi:MAG: hypothetical protein RL044_243 [Actinomycetota bacterium]